MEQETEIFVYNCPFERLQCRMADPFNKKRDRMDAFMGDYRQSYSPPIEIENGKFKCIHEEVYTNNNLGKTHNGCAYTLHLNLLAGNTDP